MLNVSLKTRNIADKDSIKTYQILRDMPGILYKNAVKAKPVPLSIAKLCSNLDINGANLFDCAQTHT